MPLIARLRLRAVSSQNSLSRAQLRSGALQDLLLAVCLFFDESNPFDTIAQHIASVEQAISFVSQQDRLEKANAGTVEGVFNPFAPKKLESLTPPRPSVAALTPAAAWGALGSLCTGVKSAIVLAEIENWTAIEVGLTGDSCTRSN